jgi:ATP-dependent protease ClpP protease subunit
VTSWSELVGEFTSTPSDNRQAWIESRQNEALNQISQLRDDRNVILYWSSWLQRPDAPPMGTQLTHEDLNGFMGALYEMDCSKGLTLVLHTPGGQVNSVETIVEYLRSKFEDFEVVVPTLAMSGGTMISLASDRIWMGRQSQLGPIDPQMGRFSAQGLVDQFENARAEIVGSTDAEGNHVTGNLEAAHLWAPLLQSMGPALLQEARNALEYGRRMVTEWMSRYMFAGDEEQAAKVAHFFSDATNHKSHGRRIGRDEAREMNVVVEDLEPNQALQEAVLTLYHLATIVTENSNATKFILASHGRSWMKNSPRQVAAG